MFRTFFARKRRIRVNRGYTPQRALARPRLDSARRSSSIQPGTPTTRGCAPRCGTTGMGRCRLTCIGRERAGSRRPSVPVADWRFGVSFLRKNGRIRSPFCTAWAVASTARLSRGMQGNEAIARVPTPLSSLEISARESSSKRAVVSARSYVSLGYFRPLSACGLSLT